MVLLEPSLLGSIRQSYHLDRVVILPSVGLQAMVPTNNGGGTVNTLKIQDETLFDSSFEAIRVYKYPTLSCMKEYESVNKSLMILGCESIEKVLSILLLFL